MEPLAQGILDFWCGSLDEHGDAPQAKKDQWFRKDDSFDAQVSRRYKAYLETAFMGAQDRWLETPGGAAAAIILVDQFPRNIYRGQAKAFGFDAKALGLCLLALSKGQHLKAPATYGYFIVMPTMHSETLRYQDEGIKAFTELVDLHQGSAKETLKSALGYAQAHREIIARFGRFPHRNALLGRENTSEEERYTAAEF